MGFQQRIVCLSIISQNESQTKDPELIFVTAAPKTRVCNRPRQLHQLCSLSAVITVREAIAPNKGPLDPSAD